MGIAKQCGQWQRKIEVKGGIQSYIFSFAEKWHFSSLFKIKLEAHDKQKGFEFCRVGDCDDFQVVLRQS